ncbi:hypothetical protein Mpsy_1582 [Methanolobus psychrophilus R15]|nr:hypothetical protein Mpsy_1582 [Methanolobus psychrophilus R15]
MVPHSWQRTITFWPDFNKSCGTSILGEHEGHTTSTSTSSLMISIIHCLECVNN